MICSRLLTTLTLALGAFAAPIDSTLVARSEANVNTADNARQAQALNAKFAALKEASTCKGALPCCSCHSVTDKFVGDEIACVAGILAQCKAGKWDLSLQCPQGTTCYAIPRTDSTGTDLQCTTQSTLGGLMTKLGVQGGVNGTDNATYETETAAPTSALPTSALPSAAAASSASTSIRITGTSTIARCRCFGCMASPISRSTSGMYGRRRVARGWPPARAAAPLRRRR